MIINNRSFIWQILAGARINEKNADGRTALALAAMEGHTDICRALLDNGADPNIVSETLLNLIYVQF